MVETNPERIRLIQLVDTVKMVACGKSLDKVFNPAFAGGDSRKV